MVDDAPSTNDNTPSGEPTGPTLADLLQMEPDQVPAEHSSVSLADLRTYISERDGQVAARVTNEISERIRANDEARRATEREQATVQDDIDYAANLQSRLLGTDEAARIAAQAELQQNEARYARGLSAKYQRASSEQENKFLQSHYMPMFTAIRSEHQAFIDSLTPDNMAKAGPAGVIGMAIQYGRDLGYAAGKTEGAAEAGRENRINENAEGPRRMGAPGAGGGETRQVDLSKRGAGRQLLRSEA